MERACEFSYDSLRCKISRVSLKLDGTVLDRFNIDLIGVVGIRELSNDDLIFFAWVLALLLPKRTFHSYQIPYQIFRR